MKDIKIGQGETIRQTITVDQTGADTATFIATDGETNLIDVEVNFVDMEANISTTATVIPIGSYDYYIKIVWDDGTVDYLPDFSNCEEEQCAFPQLIICEVPGVS
jgi:hypothetical protein